MKLLRFLLALTTARKNASGLSGFVLQTLLVRGFARTPMGLITMFVLRRALTGEGRLFGMNLASRRQARMTWLAGMLGRRG